MRNENVANTIWDDLDHLGDDAFMLYIWSFTNTKCGMAGMYPVTRRTLVEGRFDETRLAAALAELEGDDKLFYVDGILWNKARVSHLAGFEKGRISDFIVRSIIKDLKAVDPANPLVSRFIERYRDHPSLGEIQTLSRPSPDPLKTKSASGDSEGLETLQRQRTETETEQVDTYDSVIQALDRVAFNRSLASPKPKAAAKVCEEFASFDLDHLVGKFEHYWTEGPGAKKAFPQKDVVWAWRLWLEREDPKRTPRRPAPKSDLSAYSRIEAAA